MIDEAAQQSLPEIITLYSNLFRQHYHELEEETGNEKMPGSKRREWMKNRVQTAFSKENIDNLQKDEAIDIVSNFYSIEYGGGRVLDKNSHIEWASGIVNQGFIEKSKNLLYGNGSFQDRYLEFLTIKGLNHGIASEFLCYYDPTRYGMILGSIEKALMILGVNKIDIPRTGKKAGEYALAFFDILKQILAILRKEPTFTDADLLTLDYLLYSISQSKFWRIAGGKNGGLWQDGTWQKNGIASFGSTGIEEKLGEKILNVKESGLSQTYSEIYPDKTQRSKKETVKLLNIFLHKVSEGDVFLVNKGTTAILGYGIVKSKPKFTEKFSDSDFSLYRDVIWMEKYLSIPVPEELKDLFEQTISDLSYKSYKKLLSNSEIYERAYWKIAPGENARFENVWNEKGVVSLGCSGFPEYFDQINQEEDQDSFQDFFQKIIASHLKENDTRFISYDTPGRVKSKSGQLWQFIHGVKIGDMIVANRGIHEIIGIGEVTSDAFLDNSLEYPFVRNVKWIYSGLSVPKPRETGGNWQTAIIPLDKEDFNRIMKAIEMKDPLPKEYQKIEELLNNKKQVVLYGPPGTGKTYHAKNFISMYSTKDYVIPDKSLLDQRVYILTVYAPRDGDVTTLKTGEKFVYQWTERRNWQRYFEELQEGDIAIVYFAITHQLTTIVRCVNKENENISFEIVQQFQGPFFKDLRNDPYLKETGLGRGTMGFSLKALNEGELDRIIKISPGLSYETLGIILNKTEETVKNTEFVTFHPSFGYEEFIEGLRPFTKEDGSLSYRVEEGIFKEFSRRAFNILCSNAGIENEWTDSDGIPLLDEEEKKKFNELASKVPFYLVIDEINRGDISRIFGELITLVESDKRYSEENEIITILPYSKQSFSIPPNLYIVGTMNTADKSIALIDIALRRRFGFIELMPKPEILQGIIRTQDPEIQKIRDIAVNLLSSINSKIIESYDRDHQIGHSYFTKLKDANTAEDAVRILHFIWYHEIMPLLQEYYYDSPGKLQEIVGNEFIAVTNSNRSFQFKDELCEDEFMKAVRKLLNEETRPDASVPNE